jgi:hypothetical protein
MIPECLAEHDKKKCTPQNSLSGVRTHMNGFERHEHRKLYELIKLNSSIQLVVDSFFVGGRVYPSHFMIDHASRNRTHGAVNLLIQLT